MRARREFGSAFTAVLLTEFTRAELSEQRFDLYESVRVVRATLTAAIRVWTRCTDYTPAKDFQDRALRLDLPVQYGPPSVASFDSNTDKAPRCFVTPLSIHQLTRRGREHSVGQLDKSLVGALLALRSKRTTEPGPFFPFRGGGHDTPHRTPASFEDSRSGPALRLTDYRAHIESLLARASAIRRIRICGISSRAESELVSSSFALPREMDPEVAGNAGRLYS